MDRRIDCDYAEDGVSDANSARRSAMAASTSRPLASMMSSSSSGERVSSVDFRGRQDIEVVLLGSDSIETLKRTQGHYFQAPTEPDLSMLASR